MSSTAVITSSPSSFKLPTISCRKTRIVPNMNTITMKRKPTVLDCKRFIGAPMTSHQAQSKLDSCPRFRQMTNEYTSTTGGGLVNRAIALDYGNRLRACLLETKNRKVKHSTPY
jgi:hypothetical protein